MNERYKLTEEDKQHIYVLYFERLENECAVVRYMQQYVNKNITRGQVNRVIRNYKEGLKHVADAFNNAREDYYTDILSDHEENEFSSESEKKEEKKPALQNYIPKVYEEDFGGAEEIVFGLIGDTQFGSKYAQISALHNFYHMLAARGVTNVYHTGDITDGLKMRVGHEYELYASSADELLADVVTNYPKIEGIKTSFITGNHDASIYKQVGYDIGKAIANERPDMEYLGRDCAVVNLTKNCTLELRHPWDGTAYALSYKPQKMIESMESDSKPNILAIGHYHKAEYLFYRNIHCFQTGCFQGQTPFTRGKGISVHLGGWIVRVRVNPDGTIYSIAPEFVPFYKAIKDDYKNFR